MICSISGAGRANVEVLAQADVRDQLAAHIGQMLAVGRLHVGLRQLDALQRVGQRQHKEGVADAHQQAVDDGQRQRQAQRHRGPQAGLAGHVDRAAQAVHPLPHHIHAHAAAGDIGDLLGRRKARLEDEA